MPPPDSDDDDDDDDAKSVPLSRLVSLSLHEMDYACVVAHEQVRQYIAAYNIQLGDMYREQVRQYAPWNPTAAVPIKPQMMDEITDEKQASVVECLLRLLAHGRVYLLQQLRLQSSTNPTTTGAMYAVVRRSFPEFIAAVQRTFVTRDVNDRYSVHHHPHGDKPFEATITTH